MRETLQPEPWVTDPVTSPPLNARWRGIRRALTPWLFMAPALTLFTFFVLLPIGETLLTSLYRWDGLGEKAWVGWGNYTELFGDERFIVALKNNALWLIFFFLAPPLGLGIALFLNQEIFGIRLVKSLFFFPFVLSQVVVGLVFSWFFDPSFGLLTTVLGAFGIEPIAVLSDERYVTYGIILAGLWPQVSYCMVLYLTGLSAMRRDLLEAARLDGARGFSLLRHIVLPELRPATFIAVVVTVIGALRSFDLVAIMTAGGPYGSSTVLAYAMYEQSIFNYRMGYGAALATVLFAIMSIYIAYFLYRMLQREHQER